jgi:hypothetical protein
MRDEESYPPGPQTHGRFVQFVKCVRFFRLPVALFRDEGGGRTQTAQATLDQDLH